MRRQQEPMDALFLAETLAARLCHDLSGQVNALVGAVEIMREDAGPDSDVIGLANEAGEALVRRLRLARAAWGGAGGSMSMTDWRSLVEGMPRRGVQIDLDGISTTGIFAAPAARLSLNVMLLACESLPGGGVVQVAGQPSQDFVVRLHGARAGWPPGFAGMIADPDAALAWLRDSDMMGATRTLQAALTALIAHATGLRINLLLGSHTEDSPPLLVGLAPVQ